MDLSHLVIGLHLATAHAGEQIPMESATPGVYAVAPSGWAGGVYRNSFARTSVWAGHVFETADRRFALTVGAVTGYDRQYGQRYCRPGKVHVEWQPCYHGSSSWLKPLAAASVRIPVDNKALRLSYMPKVGDGAHAIHLSVEF